MGITKHFYTEIEPDPSGIKQFILDTHPASPICEKCGIEMQSKGHSRSAPRVIYDIDGGEPVKLLYRPKRYRCEKCKASIPDPNAPPMTKEKGSSDFQAFLSQKLLSNSKMTVKDIAVEHNVSPAYVSMTVQKHLSHIKSTVCKYLPCSKLWFEVWAYHQSQCVVAFGYAPQLRMWVLLDVIEAGNDAQLSDLCAKVSNPQEMHCPLDPWLVKTLKAKFPKATIKISRSEFLSKLDLAFTEAVAGVPDDVYTAACVEVDKIRKGMLQGNGFGSFQMMEDWFLALADEIDPILYSNDPSKFDFSDFYTDTAPYLSHVYADMVDPDQEPDCVGRIRALIGKYHRSKVPMSCMQLHLLYQKEFFRRTLKENNQMVYRGGYNFAGVSKIPQIEEWINCYTIIP